MRTMKLSDLIEDLTNTLKTEGDLVVLLSSDAEGNDIREFSDLSVHLAYPETYGDRETGAWFIESETRIGPDDPQPTKVMILWPI